MTDDNSDDNSIVPKNNNSNNESRKKKIIHRIQWTDLVHGTTLRQPELFQSNFNVSRFVIELLATVLLSRSLGRAPLNGIIDLNTHTFRYIDMTNKK